MQLNLTRNQKNRIKICDSVLVALLSTEPPKEASLESDGEMSMSLKTKKVWHDHREE